MAIAVGKNRGRPWNLGYSIFRKIAYCPKKHGQLWLKTWSNTVNEACHNSTWHSAVHPFIQGTSTKKNPLQKYFLPIIQRSVMRACEHSLDSKAGHETGIFEGNKKTVDKDEHE